MHLACAYVLRGAGELLAFVVFVYISVECRLSECSCTVLPILCCWSCNISLCVWCVPSLSVRVVFMGMYIGVWCCVWLF